MDALPEHNATAIMAAAARAAHLVVDQPPHFLVDEHARNLLGEAGQTALGYHVAHPNEPILAAARASTTIRSRYTESLLLASRCRQYIVLGAGLDTSGIRVAAPSGRAVFDADRPTMLAWREQTFTRAGIGRTPGVTSVPVDLAVDALPSALANAGFSLHEPAFVAWLGVTMYLAESAVHAVLDQLTNLPAGSELVLDHILPPHDRDKSGSDYARALAAAVAANGEPWKTSTSGAQLASVLTELGWHTVTCVGEADSLPPRLWDRTDALRPQRLVGLVHAIR